MLDLAGVEPRREPQTPASDVTRRIEIRMIDANGSFEALPGDRGAAFEASVTWQVMVPTPGILRAYQAELSISCRDPQRAGVQVIVPLGEPATHFMIPGIVYGETRLEDCTVRYPRVLTNGAPDDALTSNHWAFRVDRASHPVVIGWTETTCTAVATDELSALGPGGLGFRGGSDSCLVVNVPAREEPVTYLGYDAPAAPEVMTHDWQAGENVTIRFNVFQLPSDPHAYDTVLRYLYRRDREEHGLNPWVSIDEAAELSAHGLYQWHYRDEAGILAETVAFHREAIESVPVTGDREEMHVAWLSGAPAAYALLTYGRSQGIFEYVDAAVRVLDTIAGGLAPCGSFWGRWTRHGWDGGWNGHRDWIHARTIAEATLFMTRASHFEDANGVSHPAWNRAIAANLAFALRAQRSDGAFPALVHGQSGEAASWDGAAGILWIAALLEGSMHLASEAEQTAARRAAERAGAYYARFVEDEFIYGAPEDINLAPSSEDGYNAVIAYLALFEAMHQSRWLDLARRAADWMLSFRWSYNLAFPRHTILESYDFRSRGADLASPRNQHLHGYGLICVPEMVRLADHCGDDYYLERTRDNLACFLQFIAREDGDFNARRGMVSERYYNSRCLGPKGAILPVSHAWSAGLVLYACQAGLSVDG